MITLTTGRPVGPTLRMLRLSRGYSVRRVAHVAHISPNGVLKREKSNPGYIDMFVEHVGALGFDVALVPARHPHARPTGTGWPT